MSVAPEVAPFAALAGHAGYRAGRVPLARLDARHALVVAPLAATLGGARVLDLGAHDGRWSWAFAKAGAAQVTGIEARGDLIERFADFPDPAAKARVTLMQGDIFAGCETLLDAGARFDIVAILGVFYHVMDHMRLLRLVHALAPRQVVIDSEFTRLRAPTISLVRERTDNPLNAIAPLPGGEVAVKGIPSRRALEVMADTLGWRVRWLEPEFPGGSRGVRDYLGPRARRATCHLVAP